VIFKRPPKKRRSTPSTAHVPCDALQKMCLKRNTLGKKLKRCHSHPTRALALKTLREAECVSGPAESKGGAAPRVPSESRSTVSLKSEAEMCRQNSAVESFPHFAFCFASVSSIGEHANGGYCLHGSARPSGGGVKPHVAAC